MPEALPIKKVSWLDRLLGERPTVPGETLFRAQEPVDFLGFKWSVLLGVVQDRIFRISLRCSPKNETLMTATMVTCVDHCLQTYGPLTPATKTQPEFWKTDFGTVSVHGQAAAGPGTSVRLVKFEFIARLEFGSAFRPSKN